MKKRLKYLAIAQTALDSTDIWWSRHFGSQMGNARGAFYKGSSSLLRPFVEDESDQVPGHDQLLTLKKK